MGLLSSSTESMAMWVWATQHPYLYTLIKISTPTMMVVLMFVASKIMFGFGRKRYR